jgi:hypothetical protein
MNFIVVKFLQARTVCLRFCKLKSLRETPQKPNSVTWQAIKAKDAWLFAVPNRERYARN